MRSNIYIIIFGLILGGLITLAFLPILSALKSQPPPGSTFESLSDLRSQIVKHDQRDLKAGSVSLRSIITPHQSDLIIYEQLPNLSVTFQGVALRTNNCGLRGKDTSPLKPHNTKRIALLGDSFAFGWGVAEEKIFASILASELNSFLNPEINIELLNLGTPGYSTFQQVALFQEKLLDFQPDLVLVFMVDNDFGLPFFVRDVNSTGSLMDGISFAKLSWSKSDPKVNAAKNNLNESLDPNRALRHLAKLGDNSGFKVAVAINPNKSSKSVKDKLYILRDRKDLIYIPLRRDILKFIEDKKLDPKALSLPNDPHPSAIKHKILAGSLFKYILPELIEG